MNLKPAFERQTRMREQYPSLKDLEMAGRELVAMREREEAGETEGGEIDAPETPAERKTESLRKRREWMSAFLSRQAEKKK